MSIPQAGSRISEIEADRAFIDFLDRAGASLVVSLSPTYLGCFGALDGRLSTSMTAFSGNLGIGYSADRLAVASQREIIVYALSRRLAPHYAPKPDHHDGIFVPIGVYVTGECSIHDIVVDSGGALFVNTKFSCIARADLLNNFTPVWQPPFISTLMPEDRCHLNSFAIAGNRVKYITAFAASDVKQGYRTLPIDAGLLMDITTGQVVLSGLVKPHSVRVFSDVVYVLNSGAGEVLQVDPTTGSSTVLARLPGFTRGLCAIGDALFVGLSRLRATATGLALPIASTEREILAGVAAIDRHTGETLGLLRLSSDIEEVFDVVIVPGLRRGLVQPPGQKHIGIETPAGAYWMRAGDRPEGP